MRKVRRCCRHWIEDGELSTVVQENESKDNFEQNPDGAISSLLFYGPKLFFSILPNTLNS